VLGVFGVYDWVLLGIVVFSLLINSVCFLVVFSYFHQINAEMSNASLNFQQSNQSIAEAIVSLGSLLDDLDEVSGDLVRPPAMGDVLAQGLQMLMMSKFQQMLPQGMPDLGNMFKDQRETQHSSWPSVDPNQNHDQSIKEHLN